MTSPRLLHRFAAHLGFRSLDTPLFAHAARSANPVDQITFAAAQGLAGVFDPWHLSRPEADQARIVAAVRECGLATGTVVCGLMSELRTPLWLPRDDEGRGRLARRIDAAFDAAGRLGGQVIGVVAGRWPDLDPATQETMFAATLAEVAGRAQERGLVLAIEAINPLAVPGLLLTSYAQAERIVRAVAHPALGLMFDTAHLAATDPGDPVADFHRTRDLVAVVQIANHPGRSEPAIGEIDMTRVLRAITADNRDRLIELEHLWATPSAETEWAGLGWLRAVDAML